MTTPPRLDVTLLGPALLAWAIGAATLGATPVVGVAVAGAGLVIAVVALRRGTPHALVIELSALLTSLIVLAGAGHAAMRTAGGVPALAADRATIAFEGTVLADPVTLSPGSERRQALVIVRVAVEKVTGRGHERRVGTPILVFGGTEWAHLRWHERIRARGRLAAAAPGDDVVALLRASAGPVRIAPAGAVFEAAERVRQGMRQAVSGLPEDARGLVPALVIGDRSLTPKSLTDDMRATGLTHLCAVSGSNVAIVLGAALLLCRLCGLRRRWRPWPAAILLLLFVILARPEPSVIRAAVMGGVGLIGFATSRRGTGPSALGVAVVALLVYEPWLARSYGFALSVLATLGLILFARPWGCALRKLPGLRRCGPLADAVAIPLAAQAVCAPVIVVLQGSVSVIGVAANLAAAPLVAPATILGVVVAVLAVPLPWVASAVAWLAALPAGGIAAVAHGCALVPFGTMPWPDGASGALLLAGLTLAVLLAGPWLVSWAARRPWLAGAVAVLVLGSVLPPPMSGWPPAGWRLAVCEVGQGDAIVMATGAGRAVVVDTGPDPALVDACLDRLEVDVIDAVVLTHFHADHVDGLSGVLSGREVGEVLATPVREPVEIATAVDRELGRRGHPVRPVFAGDVLAWGDLVARVRWPERKVDSGSVPNNGGVVLDVLAPEMRMVLFADIEREAAAVVRRRLRQSARVPDEPPVQVIKVAHHGSFNQDPELLRELAAPVGVVSVGADNDYGHPAPSLLRWCSEAGTTLYRTDRDGDVLVGWWDARLGVARRRSRCPRHPSYRDSRSFIRGGQRRRPGWEATAGGGEGGAPGHGDRRQVTYGPAS